MSHHLMRPPDLALSPKHFEVDHRYNNSLSRTWRGLSQDPPVIVHHHTPARPRERWVVLQARTLIRSHNVGQILECAATVDYGPPIHWFRAAKRIHVSRTSNEDLGTISR